MSSANTYELTEIYHFNVAADDVGLFKFGRCQSAK